MNSYESAFMSVARMLDVVCGAIVCVMAVHVVADVMARYLFSAPIAGTIEIVSFYYMVGAIFLPLPYITFRRRHFAAEVFTDNAPPALRRIILLFADIVTAVLAGFATWQSIVTAVEKTAVWEHLETARYIILQWPGRWLVVIGFGLMCVAACFCLLADLRSLAYPTRTGEQHDIAG